MEFKELPNPYRPQERLEAQNALERVRRALDELTGTPHRELLERPLPRREKRRGKPSLLERKIEEEGMPAVGEITDKLLSAIDEIVEKTPGVFARFEQAFKERAGVRGLPESQPEDPLLSVLASRLGQAVPEKYYTDEYYDNDRQAAVNGEFLTEMRSAIEELKDRHPRALALVWRTHQDTNGPLELQVRAALAFYADNKEMIPF